MKTLFSQLICIMTIAVSCIMTSGPSAPLRKF